MPMTLEEIKAAVDAGKTVHWVNSQYTVIKDENGRYRIGWKMGTPHESYVNLVKSNGKLNGGKHEFHIGGAK